MKHTKAELEEAISIWSKVDNGKHMHLIMDAAKARLSQMKNDVWIPAQGVIVEGTNTGNWHVTRSLGFLDSSKRLCCAGNTRWEVLRPLKNTTQWTSHDQSPECPCDPEKGVHVVFIDMELRTYPLGMQAPWINIIAYSTDELVIENER